MQPDAFADAVVVLVKNALAPVLADVKTLQSQVAAFDTRWNDVGAMRERIAVLEAKSVPVPVVAEPAPVDLSPVLSVLGDVRDRLVAVETKSAEPAPEPAPVDLSPVIDRITALEAMSYTKASVDAVADVLKEQGAIRERLAVVEVRAQIPGPPGKDGTDGAHGQPGKDGADGVGFDDLLVTQSDERSFTIKAARGERVKEIGTVRFPVEIYRGVFVEGKAYERGDCVTWGGSEWHANDATTVKPGDGSKAWTLKVKKGRDGKDGRDAEGPAPVVKLR